MRQDGTVRRLHLMPPAPDVCATCATDHAPDEPHNRDSLYYQMAFRQQHGRWPTWEDAMAHCEADIQEVCRQTLADLGVAID